MVVALEISQAVQKLTQQHQAAANHHNKHQGQGNVEVLVKPAIGIDVPTGRGAQSDYFQKHSAQKKGHQNQDQDERSGDVQQCDKGVVLALAQVEELGVHRKKSCLQDPGAQLLRRQGQKVAERVSVQRYQRADDDQHDLHRQRISVEEFGDCRKHTFGQYTTLAGLRGPSDPSGAVRATSAPLLQNATVCGNTSRAAG